MAEKLIPLEDAQSIVLAHVNPTELVDIPVWQAAGLPLAADAVSTAVFSAFWIVSSLLSHTTTCTSQPARAAHAA